MALLQIYDFTPLHAVIGGVLLGTATVMRMWLTGRILGVSGQAGGLVKGKAAEPHRWLFLGGLVAGGLGLQYLGVYPEAFGKTHVAVWRSLAGGLAVGLGAGLGNGCTSGHGICGNARLSKRSIAYTLTFMATGFAVGSLLKSASHVTTTGLPQPPAVAVFHLASRLLGAHLLAYATAVTLASLDALSAPSAVSLLSFIDGSLFAAGLGISGMTSPARVAQFLDISAGTWNPTLAFVMGGALGLVAPFMLLLVAPKRIGAPVLAKGFDLPASGVIDRKLLLGGVLFGAGWATAGMCPGPAIVNLASPHGPPLLFLAAMMAGLGLSDKAAVCKIGSAQQLAS